MLSFSIEKTLEVLDTTIQNLPKEEAFTSWSVITFAQHRNRYAHDLALLKKYYTHGDILELGAAPFHMTYCLQNLGLPYTAVDIYPERGKHFMHNHKLHVLQHDIEQASLPFEDHSFSYVMLNEVFEHLRINPIFTLKEIRRVLKPGGLLVLTTPNLYSLGNILRFLIGKGIGSPYREFQKLERLGHMGHIREYSTRDVQEFLFHTGFARVTIHHVYYQGMTSSSWREFGKASLYKLLSSLSPYLVFIASSQDKVDL